MTFAVLQRSVQNGNAEYQGEIEKYRREEFTEWPPGDQAGQMVNNAKRSKIYEYSDQRMEPGGGDIPFHNDRKVNGKKDADGIN